MMHNYQNYEKRSTSAALLLFLIGLFSQTQISIGGKLGISEFVMLVFSPFVFISNISLFRHDRCLNFFWLILCWLAGALFVDIYTNNYFLFMMKGIAVPITIFANSVCIYVLLRKNFENLKWLLLGIAISGVISIFIFQRGAAGDVALDQGLMAGAEQVMGYKLFWAVQLTTWLTLPICGWYMKINKAYSIIVVLFIAIFNIVTGGRSAFLESVVSLMLLIVGGKTYKSTERIKRHIIFFLLGLLVLGIMAKGIYQYAVINGYMGEEEQRKYEMQTKVDNKGGALSLIISGRGEVFISLFAALDKPLLGNGSFPIDDRGYVEEFLSKYGTEEEYKRAEQRKLEFGVRLLPWHSHIVTYWTWHGFFGLLFWVYVVGMTLKTLFLRLHIYVPWFGYFAIMIPAFCWDVLFSPLGLRVNTAAFFVAMLFVSRLHKFQNNQYLEFE